VLQSSSQRASIWQEHQAIAEAIAQGEVQRAGELAEQHTHRASVELLRRLGEVLAEAPVEPA
jgi:DNA-binding GntR family transcriptional regulator